MKVIIHKEAVKKINNQFPTLFPNLKGSFISLKTEIQNNYDKFYYS